MLRTFTFAGHPKYTVIFPLPAPSFHLTAVPSLWRAKAERSPSGIIMMGWNGICFLMRTPYFARRGPPMAGFLRPDVAIDECGFGISFHTAQYKLWKVTKVGYMQ